MSEDNLDDFLDIPPTVEKSDQIRSLTLMTSMKIKIYPNGNIYLADKKAWINETKSQPKARKKVKREGEQAKLEDEEVY